MWGVAEGVVAPDDGEAAVPHVGIGGAPALSQGGLDGVLRGSAADAALQLAGPEAVPEAGAANGHLHEAEGTAVAVGQDGLGAVAGHDFLPAAGDLIESLLPGDTPPSSTPLGADAAQGVHEAVGV